MNKQILERAHKLEKMISSLEYKHSMFQTALSSAEPPLSFMLTVHMQGTQPVAIAHNNTEMDHIFNHAVENELRIALDRLDRLCEKELDKLKEEYEML